MTARTPTYLKARFETGDIPTATDYEDVFDSCANIETSAVQNFAGPIYSLELNSPLVSATSGIFSFVSAASGNFSFVSAQTINATYLNAVAVSAVTVSATDVHVSRKTIGGYQAIIPTGASQSSAASANYDITEIFVSAGGVQERGVILSEHHKGRVQYIVNDSTSVTAATIYPSFGCNFIGTAANGGMLLAAGQTIQVIHVHASAYSFVRY